MEAVAGAPCKQGKSRLFGHRFACPANLPRLPDSAPCCSTGWTSAARRFEVSNAALRCSCWDKLGVVGAGSSLAGWLCAGHPWGVGSPVPFKVGELGLLGSEGLLLHLKDRPLKKEEAGRGASRQLRGRGGRKRPTTDGQREEEEGRGRLRMGKGRGSLGKSMSHHSRALPAPAGSVLGDLPL